MEGKLNAYATTMAGRPIMRNTATQHTPKHNTTTIQQDKPIIITRNKGYNLWQWLRKYGK